MQKQCSRWSSIYPCWTSVASRNLLEANSGSPFQIYWIRNSRGGAQQSVAQYGLRIIGVMKKHFKSQISRTKLNFASAIWVMLSSTPHYELSESVSLFLTWDLIISQSYLGWGQSKEWYKKYILNIKASLLPLSVCGAIFLLAHTLPFWWDTNPVGTYIWPKKV